MKHGRMTPAGCLALLLTAPACGDEDDSEYTLRFAAQAGAAGVDCGATYTNMGASGGSIRVRDFRLFVSNLRLVGPQGEEAPLELEQDGVWQVSNVALLDFEDGTETCSETGNSSENRTVRGTSSLDEVQGLRFDLGVPFGLNHLDSATQPAPLNLTSMHWNWRGGYKFFRIDLENEQQPPNHIFNLHLGSTACVSDSPVEAPSAPCGRPNLPEIALDGFDPDVNTVVFDLEALLANVDTSTNTVDTPPGCMSAPTEPADCTEVFDNLGMAFDTGACMMDCAGQRFVRMD